MHTFEGAYAPLLGHRAPTWRAALDLALSQGKPLTVVETGCLREQDNWVGDGQSSIIMEWLAARTGGVAYATDIDPQACATARACVDHGNILENDSVEFLAAFGTTIDFLYLDSFDFNGNTPLESAHHHLFELVAANRWLAQGSIVLVDDTWREQDGRIFGKGMLIAEYMQKIGARVITEGYQMGWQL